MKVLIIGGVGFFGQCFVCKLFECGELIGLDGCSEKIDELVLFDVVKGSDFGDVCVMLIVGDIVDCVVFDSVIDMQMGVIFYFVVIVSG